MNQEEKAQQLIECFKSKNNDLRGISKHLIYFLFEETYFLTDVSVSLIKTGDYWYVSAEMKYGIDLFYDDYFERDYPDNYLKFKNYLRLKKLSQGCFND